MDVGVCESVCAFGGERVAVAWARGRVSLGHPIHLCAYRVLSFRPR